jgi:hypothetical protein
MRLAIFDSIQEAHVAQSLERALVARGHEVLATGRIGSGFEFASSAAAVERLSHELDEVLAWRPDVILVFRPASLPPPLLERARRSPATLVAWFSDDPVLYQLSYGPVVDAYDLVLHCGGEAVLRFYEERHGRPTGVNFPFWTDTTAFPPVYGSREPETTAMFLGNVHNEVRRRRYLDLGRLRTPLRIHGLVGRDYHRLSGGYLDSDAEVVDAGSRVRVGINIPQYFADRAGLPTWFPGLDELGFFQFPSRVVQYAAMGVPIVSVAPSPADLDTFPEIVCVPSTDELDATIAGLLDGGQLDELSTRTHERFQRHFSAASRVLALEALLAGDDWRSLDAGERARWFTRFDGSGAPSTDVRVAPPAPEAQLAAHLAAAPVAGSFLSVAVVASRWEPASAAAVASRALTSLGHRVWGLTPDGLVTPDPLRDYAGSLDVDLLQTAVGELPDVLVLVGDSVVLSAAAADRLRSAGVRTVLHAVAERSCTARVSRLAALVDRVTVLDPDAVDAFRDAGFASVVHVPHLVDRDYLRMLASTPASPGRVGVLGAPDAVDALTDGLADASGTGSLEELAAVARSSLVALAPAGPGQPLTELTAFGLAGGSLCVAPRDAKAAGRLAYGVEVLAAASGDELRRKLARLLTHEDALLALRSAGTARALREHAAEEAWDGLLGSLS